MVMRDTSIGPRAEAAPTVSPASMRDYFGGQTTKHRWGGSFRSRPPSETLELLRPRLREWGVTRVGNITGLDRIGIPVWIAVRPNSRSLAVSQEKGMDHDSARASAVMEALEIAHAERPPPGLRLESYSMLRAQAKVVDVCTLPEVRRSLFTENRKVLWVQGHDLLNQQACYLPYELVHSDATVPRMPGSGAFLASTNGLASGNDLGEAVLHGLCEVIERDATALWEFQDDAGQQATRLDLESVTDAAAMDLLHKLASARLSVMAWNATSDIAVPVVRCVIVDTSDDTALRPIPAAFGAGCHPDRNVALIRALTEAAQSRLTVISGSRDDFDRDRYRTTQQSEAFRWHRELSTQPARASMSELPTSNCDTIEEDIAVLLNGLVRAGVQRVIVKDLSCEGMPVSVARVVVPTLEGPAESAAYVAGPRARLRNAQLR